MKIFRPQKLLSAALLALLASAPALAADENRVIVRDFDWKVYATSHFDIHYYAESEPWLFYASGVLEDFAATPVAIAESPAEGVPAAEGRLLQLPDLVRRQQSRPSSRGRQNAFDVSCPVTDRAVHPSARRDERRIVTRWTRIDRDHLVALFAMLPGSIDAPPGAHRSKPRRLQALHLLLLMV